MGVSLREYLWRNRWRFTAEEFSKKIEIDRFYLSKIANGALIPSMPLAKRIELETGGEVIWHEVMQFCYESQKEKQRAQSLSIDQNKSNI